MKGFDILWIGLLYYGSYLVQGFLHRTCMKRENRIRFQAQSTKLHAENKGKYAILFDCDGVIVETEELHRIAYNQAFQDYGIMLPSNNKPVEWDVEYYDKLQNTVGGGKPKMRYYFNKEKQEWPMVTKSLVSSIEIGLIPKTKEEQELLVDELQNSKTNHYLQNIANAKARPGIIELLDEILAIKSGKVVVPYELKIGICSASSREGFEKLTEIVVGPERLKQIDVIIAGDDVSQRKPHPMIYEMAADRIKVPRENCVVIEDSLIGLAAAKGANMKCIITYTPSTAKEDFYGNGADAKLKDFSAVKLTDIMETFHDLLRFKRDPK